MPFPNEIERTDLLNLNTEDTDVDYDRIQQMIDNNKVEVCACNEQHSNAIEQSIQSGINTIVTEIQTQNNENEVKIDEISNQIRNKQGYKLII